MDYVIERTHIIDHERFLEAGPHARDLWEWGLKYSGKHELDGFIPMAAVLASPWGYGGKANLKAANKLVEVGLWGRAEKGFVSLKWTEMGNKTRAQLEVAREAERKKKAAQRRRDAGAMAAPSEPCPSTCPPGTPDGTPSGVLNSPSYSLSESRSREGVQGDAEPPEWFGRSVGSAAMVVGDIGDVPARWLEYRASRGRKGWAMNHEDAVGWLCSVVRSERERKSRRGPARDAEITKQPFDENAPWMKVGT
jgi:hypothetical protein